jgi:hypothetical protein
MSERDGECQRASSDGKFRDRASKEETRVRGKYLGLEQDREGCEGRGCVSACA